METTDYLDNQREVQKARGERIPETRIEQREAAARYCQYLIEEVYEYLQAIAYKHFVVRREASRPQRIGELVDIQRYVYCLALLEGVTPDEWEDAFIDKGETLIKRERRQALEGKIVTLDLDGVLAEYADWDDEEAFVESAGARRIKPKPGAQEFVRWIRDHGWLPVVVTSRKRRRYPRLERDTLEWLQHHQFDVADVIWGYDKAEAVAGLDVVFHVDDSAKHAIDMAAATRVYKFPHTGSNDRLNFTGDPPEGVYCVESFVDIVRDVAREGIAQ